VPSEVVELAPERELGDLEARALATLTMAGRERTLEGGLVLKLARDLDRGGHSGSQTAALAARLMDATKVALSGAKPEPDGLDELADRRRRKAEGA
jgi:hypothetical protein